MRSLKLPDLFSLTLILMLGGCILKSESPLESTNDNGNFINSGDIVVINTPNDAILLLDEDGEYKSTLVSENDPAAIILGGITYDSVGEQLLFTYDHSTAILDEVRSISLFDARVERYLNDANLAGTLTGVLRLTGGDHVVLESGTTAEKYNSNFTRVGTPFTTGLINANAQASALSTGGFLACSSSTANTVRTYNSSATVVATATSASPTPTLGAMASTGCRERPDGTIVVAYSGTTDAVRAYSANLGTVVWTFSNTSVLSTPGRVAVRANGNVLVTDTVLNHIVEISSTGAFVRIIGGGVLATPGYLEVIP
jgi:hypothetical protein